MAQPLPYERDYDFQNFQSGHPSTPLPGDKVNAELDQVAATLDEVLARIALLQDDDTALKRGSVGYDQLAVGVSLGFEPPSAWLTATAYIVRDTVFQGAGFYQCLVSHTSGTFATDMAAGKWELLADFTSATADAEAAQAAAEAAQALAEAARDSATASASSASSNAASASASANSASADAEQTAADRIATAADRVATAADRVQTGLDVVSSAASAAAAAASAASIVIGPGGVQEYSENLAGVAAASPTDGNFIVGNGTTWTVESGSAARVSLGFGDGTVGTAGLGVLSKSTTEDILTYLDVENSAALLAKVAQAQEWAENPEDDEITGSPGSYSALHHSAKASAQRVLAETARTGAEAAESAAEAYASAAATAANFYDTIALGRAAVADTETFGVKAGGSDGLLRPTLYRRDSSSTQTLITGLVLPLEVEVLSLFPGRAAWAAVELAALPRIKSLRLFGADPAKFYSVKYLFWKDVGTRFNLTIQRSDDIDGTGAADVATYSVSSGADAWTGLREITLAASGGSGITGTTVIDFSSTAAMTVNTAPSSGAMYQRRALHPDVAVTTTARTAEINTLLATAIPPYLSTARGRRLPFLDSHDATGTVFTNALLRGFVKNAWVYAAKSGHDYRISYMRLSTTETCYIDIYDDTAGRTACRWTAPAIVGVFTDQPRYVKLRRDTLSISTWEGEYAVLELDWSVLSTAVAGSLSTMTRGGLDESCIYPDGRTADWLERDVYHEVIRVGPTRTYTTLRAAVESLYDTGTVCWRSHYNNTILIECDDQPDDYEATNLVVPDFVCIKGPGCDATAQLVPEDTTHYALLQAHFDTKIMDFTIRSDTGDGGAWAGEYCIHADDTGYQSWGGVGQTRRIRQRFDRLRLIGGPNNNTNLFGGGFSSGQHVVMNDVQTARENASATVADFAAHDTAENASYPDISAQTLPIIWEMRNCRSPNVVGAGVQVISLGGEGYHRLILDNCDFNLVVQQVTVGSVYHWTIGGVYPGAIRQSGGTGEVFPDTGYSRWMLNSTGATLVAGRFVKRTGDRTIAYAGPGDIVFGWLPANISNGADGTVVMTKAVHHNYIDGGSAGSGPWGLAANGLIDYAAATKIGETYSSIVRRV